MATNVSPALAGSEHFALLQEVPRNYWWFVVRLQHVFEAAKTFPGSAPDHDTLLDIGCGSGIYSIRLADLLGLKKVLLSDIEDFRAPEVSQSGARFIQGSIASLAQSGAQAGLITCLDVLEHTEDPVRELRTLAQCLQPEGILILTVPAFPFLFSEWDRKLGHRARYRKSQLVHELETAGLHCLESHYCAKRLARPPNFHAAQNG
jgi:2-polyprenyl-3-methyl-5-hydroxy-6-metoxy-1,4-benzoquinol methylase